VQIRALPVSFFTPWGSWRSRAVELVRLFHSERMRCCRPLPPTFLRKDLILKSLFFGMAQ
jgi:hypothetical protein